MAKRGLRLGTCSIQLDGTAMCKEDRKINCVYDVCRPEDDPSAELEMPAVRARGSIPGGLNLEAILRYRREGLPEA